MTKTLTYTPIGQIQSPFPSKFGVPRQPGLVEHEAFILLSPEYAVEHAFRYLEGFSHLWVLFDFHLIPKREWSPLIRPPRLKGNKKVGVFASRSPNRPNSIGLSLVRNGGLTRLQGRLALSILDGDLVDGTPVLDVKPYLPYAEAPAGATGGYADSKPQGTLSVTYSDQASARLQELDTHAPGFARTLTQTLALDPRPRYRPDAPEHLYGLPFMDQNIRWTVTGEVLHVVTIEPYHAYLDRQGETKD